MSVSNSPSKYIANGTSLSSIADAIRAKTGGSGQLAFPAGFVDAIGSISSGGSGGGATVKTVHGDSFIAPLVTTDGWSTSDLITDPGNGHYCTGCIYIDEEMYPMALTYDDSAEVAYATIFSSMIPYCSYLFIFSVSRNQTTGAMSSIELVEFDFYEGDQQAEFVGRLGDWYIVSVQA